MMKSKIHIILILFLLIVSLSSASACRLDGQDDIEFSVRGGIGYKISVYNHGNETITGNTSVKSVNLLRMTHYYNGSYIVPPHGGFTDGIISIPLFLRLTFSFYDDSGKNLTVEGINILGIVIITSQIDR